MRMWILLVPMFVAFVQDPATPDISWNLKPGEKVRYEIEKTVLMHAKERTVEMRMVFGLILEPGAPDAAGVAPVTITIDRVALTGKDGTTDEVYDSDLHKPDAAKNPAFKMMAGCVNGTFTSKLSKEGSLSDTAGLQEILQKAGEDIPEMKDHARVTAERFATHIGEHIQDGFAVAAGKALAKGAAWETRLATVPQLVGAAPLKIKSTVREVRPGEAVIDRELTFDFSNLPADGAKGTGKGEVTWSTAQGRLISGKWSTHVVTSRGESDVTWRVKLAPKEKK